MRLGKGKGKGFGMDLLMGGVVWYGDRDVVMTFGV